MSTRCIARCLLVVFGASVAACGSRTPLQIHPTDASDTQASDGPDVRDSGPDSGDAPDSEILQCFMGTKAIGQIPIDLYFALDRSKSMDTIDRGANVTRWEAIAAAMNTFINAPLSSGLGAGLMFFPRSTSGGSALCAPSDYAFPVVPIRTLPDVAPSIVKAISIQTRGSGGTPLTAALDGAHIYARRQQASQPTHTVSVIVVTDGVPRDCGSTLTGTAAVAAAAITGIPPIRTYVLGVGPSLGNLNTIAQAGGTTQAFLVEAAGEGSLLAALEAIRTSALACEFVLPSMTRLEGVRVTTALGAGGPPTSIDQVPNALACAGNPGWFYDNPLGGDAPPTKILLCPESCDPLVRSTGNRMDVSIGCP